jgi:hypothetical protein
METVTSNPQKTAIAVFLVFKFASTSALPEAQQASDPLTLADRA